MANYQTLKNAISDVIKTNGNNEITGSLLQQSLLAMINSLGAGWQYMGIATPSTNPGTPDYNVFYIASTAGTYSNFPGSNNVPLVVNENEVAILKYNGSWTKDTTGAATATQLDQLGQEIDKSVKDYIDKSTSDLNIGDKDGNVLVEFRQGHIRTKKFDSRLSNKQLSDPTDADLNIGDDNGNVLVEFRQGHIRTKKFDSRFDAGTIRDNFYDGKKISFVKNSFDCNSLGQAFANQTGAACQGFSIYGDYAFFFYDGGICDVATISDDFIFTKIATFNLGSYDPVTNHANNASWGVEHVDGNQFPVLYLSKGLDAKCAVENITLTGSTLVQTLYLSGYRGLVNEDTRFGYTVGDDGFLWLTGFTNPSSSLPTTRTFVAKMVLPKLSEGASVGLDLNNALEFYYLEDYGYSLKQSILQGRFIHNGLCFFLSGVGTESYPTVLYVWDLETRVMRNTLHLQTLIPTETEDADIYNNAFLMRCNPNNVVYKLIF